MSDSEDSDIVNSSHDNNTSNQPEHGEILNSGQSTENLSTRSHHLLQTVDTSIVSPVIAFGPNGEAPSFSRIAALFSEETNQVLSRNSESTNVSLQLHFHYQPIGQVIQDQSKTVKTHDTHKTKIYNVANSKKVHFGKKVSNQQDKNANPTQAPPHINETSTMEASTSTQSSSPSQSLNAETTSSEKLTHSFPEQPQLGQQTLSSSLPSCSSSPSPAAEQPPASQSSSSSEPPPPSSSMQQPTSSQRPMLKKKSSHGTTPKKVNAQAQSQQSSSFQPSNMDPTLSETKPKLSQSVPKQPLLHQPFSQPPCPSSHTPFVVETYELIAMRQTIEMLSGSFMRKLWNILYTKRKETETHQAMFVSIYNEAVDWFDSMPKPESPQLVNECRNGLDSLLKRMYEGFQIGFTAEELYEDALNDFKNRLKEILPRFGCILEWHTEMAREELERMAKGLKIEVDARISEQCGEYFLKKGNGLISAATESSLIKMVRAGLLPFFSPSRQTVEAATFAADSAHPSWQKAEFIFILADDSLFEFKAEILLELNFGKVIFLI